jgi:hypothetical protein
LLRTDDRKDRRSGQAGQQLAGVGRLRIAPEDEQSVGLCAGQSPKGVFGVRRHSDVEAAAEELRSHGSALFGATIDD